MMLRPRLHDLYIGRTVLLTVLAIVLLVGSCGVLMPWWPLFNPFV